jgi:hypothetical protein
MQGQLSVGHVNPGDAGGKIFGFTIDSELALLSPREAKLPGGSPLPRRKGRT